MILLMIAITGCGEKITPKNSNIAVITKSTTSSFFEVVFDGARSAADEYDIEITCEGPSNENDYLEQNKLIENAINNKVGAIVISAIDKDKSVHLLEEAIDEGIHVVVIDSGINSDLVEANIETNNYDAGREMAEVLLAEGDIKGKKIGIVNFDSESENVIRRESGFEDTMNANGSAEIIGRTTVDSNVGEAKKAANSFIEKHPEVDIIVTFNEWTTLGVGYAIKEKELQEEIQVIGFDNNVISVSMLENGVIDGLVVQNPYAMGYLGVEIAYQLINGTEIEQTEINTNIKFITRENIEELNSRELLYEIE